MANKDIYIARGGVYAYELVAPSATTQVLGGAGAVGDHLHCVTYTVVGTSNIIVYDGAVILFTFTGVSGVNYANTVFFDTTCATNFNITTGSGTRAVGIGTFT